MADVVFETKNFKVFLDFVKAKEAMYFLSFLPTRITIQCRSKNGNFIAERSKQFPDYNTHNRDVRIAFDSKTKDILREDSKLPVTTVSFDGQRAIFTNDDLRREFVLPYVAHPDSITFEKIPKSENIAYIERFYFLDFKKIIKMLQFAKIDLVRLRILPEREWLEVSGSNWLNSIVCKLISTQENFLPSDKYLDSFYNIIDLYHVIMAMKRHYGSSSDVTFTLSLLGTEGQLFFKSSEPMSSIDKYAILNPTSPPDHEFS